MEVFRRYNFFALKGKWKKLYENNGALTSYQSPEYASVAFSHYLPYALALRVRPVFFEIRNGGETVMIVPLCKRIFRREYTLFGDKSGYGYVDFIYGGNIAEDTMEACMTGLGKKLSGSKLVINRLREDSPLCRYLLSRSESKATECCEHIDLPETYDAYLASLKKDWRHHIRTVYNRLQNENKEVTLKMYYGEPLPREEFRRMMDLYLKRQKSRYGHSDGIIYRLFLKHFDMGSAAMRKFEDYVNFILYIGEQPAAFCNGFVSRDRSTVMLPRLAIDADFAEFSPGIVLLNESIRKITEEGIARRIDLIEGDERYKHEMGGQPHCCHEFELQF